MYCSKILGISKWIENRLKREKKTDVLFIYAESTSEKRLEYIENILRKKQVLTASSRLDNIQMQIASLLMGEGSCHIPLLLTGPHCFARYFIKRYQPKVIVISINCGVFPGILRNEINEQGGKLINIAHGTGCRGKAHTSSDFDYWFVFGQSTIDGKLANKERVGSTEAIIVGSPFLFGEQSQVNIDENNIKNTILIASQWIPNRDNYPVATRESRAIMLDFIQANKDWKFAVKLHHLETDDFWVDISKDYSNLTVYKREVSLLDALKKAYVCLHISSNASIEAGLMGVPSITIDKYKHSAHLNIDQFLPVVTTFFELKDVFESLLENYNDYQQQAKAYANYMFGGYSCGAGLRISEHILTVLRNGQLKNTQLIHDTGFLIDN